MADQKVQTLIDGLNEDLANEYAAVIQYRTYASAVSGPYCQELRQFFTTEIGDELGHAQMLADKIISLGGSPALGWSRRAGTASRRSSRSATLPSHRRLNPVRPCVVITTRSTARVST